MSKIYKKCFEISAELIMLAIDNLRDGKIILPKETASYFSFPNKLKWEMFRKNGGSFY